MAMGRLLYHKPKYAILGNFIFLQKKNLFYKNALFN